jgi:hypothetical protein
MLIGAAPETNRISAFWRIFDRAIGFFCTSHAFTWRGKYQLSQLDNVLAAGQLHQDCDRLYSRSPIKVGRRKKEEAVIAMVSAIKNVLTVGRGCYKYRASPIG